MAITRWLIDTNVVSELRRSRPDARVVGFLSAQRLDSLHISCVTMAELRYGVARAVDAAQAAEIGGWVDRTIRPMFVGRTLDVSEETMLRWRYLVEGGRKLGHTFPQPDLILAAQALEHDLTLVTRNTVDFELAHVPVLNPWLDPAG